MTKRVILVFACDMILGFAYEGQSYLYKNYCVDNALLCCFVADIFTNRNMGDFL